MSAPEPTNKPTSLQRRHTTTATLTIPSRTGHRRTMYDYFVKAGSSDFSDISIGNVKWNRIYDNLIDAILVTDLSKKTGRNGFLWYLSTIIPNFPFPTIAEDEDLVIARNSGPTTMDTYFKDDTTGDVKSYSVPGGSRALAQFMVINLNNSAAISATGTNFLDTLDMPTGLSPFSEGTDITAGGRRISPNQKFTIYAIAGEFVKTAGGSKATNLHIKEDQIELFTSENDEGLQIDPDNGSDVSFKLDGLHAFILPEPYVMQPNKLYTFQIDSTHGTDNLAVNSQKLFLIGIREITTGGA